MARSERHEKTLRESASPKEWPSALVLPWRSERAIHLGDSCLQRRFNDGLGHEPMRAAAREQCEDEDEAAEFVEGDSHGGRF